MKTEFVKIDFIKSNPNNPRIIKDDKFKKLVNSIKEFPKMLEIRPIVVNDDMVVLGGNMRLKACKEAKLKEIPIIKASDLTEEEQHQFIIKDNVGFGEWDWELLANSWDLSSLENWGLEEFNFQIEEEIEEEIEENPYTSKIEAPIYKPSDEKPQYQELYDDNKFNELIKEIEESNINKEDKQFLKLAASRHIVFNYAKIADMYAHSDKDVQQLMEKSALIIIDFEKAIELGYVRLSNEIAEQYIDEHGDDIE